MSYHIIPEFPDYSRSGFDMDRYINIYKTSNVITNASSSNTYYALHSGVLSIKYVFKGEEYYSTSLCRYKVDENNFLVINSGQRYGSYINSVEPTESFSVFFNNNFVREVISAVTTGEEKLLENSLISCSIGEMFFEKLYRKDSEIIPALSRLKFALDSGNFTSGYIEDTLHFLLGKLAVKNKELLKKISELPAAKKSTRIELFRRLSRVKDYIISCYSDNLNLSVLSRAACMNEHHLLREFKKVYGVTPHRYLTEIRLRESKKMLKVTSLPITEISARSGFEYLSSFSQLFRSKFGISPAEFRKKSQQK